MNLQDALGRVLAEDVVADSDLPPFDRSQMDGYAVRAEDARSAPVRLRIVGESAAGRGWHHQLEEGQAVRIMTGAPVPEGADSVQQVELTTNSKTAPLSNCSRLLRLDRSIVKRGAEIQAGETVLSAGTIDERSDDGRARCVWLCDCRSVIASRALAYLLPAPNWLPSIKNQVRTKFAIPTTTRLRPYAQLAGAVVERMPLTGDETSLLKNQISAAAREVAM